MRKLSRLRRLCGFRLHGGQRCHRLRWRHPQRARGHRLPGRRAKVAWHLARDQGRLGYLTLTTSTPNYPVLHDGERGSQVPWLSLRRETGNCEISKKDECKGRERSSRAGWEEGIAAMDLTVQAPRRGREQGILLPVPLVILHGGRWGRLVMIEGPEETVAVGWASSAGCWGAE